ncbi:hypothetical protein DIPPA_09741 [Diplonema papillatum]|nr:hypothetical protein DIPPA_09741 [Diplonema papillatum]KAJ9471052.1 hypothetical protein DIPPA_09741 [Diplonema papillatum]
MVPAAAVLLLLLLGCGARAEAKRIVVVGDLHGDIDTAKKIFEEAGVIQGGVPTWTGADTTLVQMGDAVDRGIDGPAIYDLIMTLQDEAPAHGGRVVMLLGNHEVMNLKGDWSFVDDREITAFGGKEQRAKALAAEGRYGVFIRSLPIVEVLGATVFCHGGLLDAFAALGVDKLNAQKDEAFRAGRFDAPVLMNDGPVWTRAVIYSAQAGNCAPLEAGLAALSAAEGREVKRMVVGHTAMVNGRMGFFCGGRLAAVDVYASAFFGAAGGWVTFLEIDQPADEAAADAPFQWGQHGPTRVRLGAKLDAPRVKPILEPFVRRTPVSTVPKVAQIVATPHPASGGRIRGEARREAEEAVQDDNPDSMLPFLLLLLAAVVALWWNLVFLPRRRLARKKQDL